MVVRSTDFHEGNYELPPHATSDKLDSKSCTTAFFFKACIPGEKEQTLPNQTHTQQQHGPGVVPPLLSVIVPQTKEGKRHNEVNDSPHAFTKLD